MRIVLVVLFASFLTACATIPCSDLTGSTHDECLIEQAATTGDTSICLDFEKDAYVTWCLSSVANVTKDLAVCDLIVDERSVDYCKRDVFLAEDDSESCATLLYEGARDSCYHDFATRRLDIDLCIEIEDRAFEDNCLNRVSRDSMNPYGCALMSTRDPDKRDGCLLSVSLAANNTEYCGSLSSTEGIAFCHINIAVKLQDPAICDQVAEAKQELCRDLVAENMG